MEYEEYKVPECTQTIPLFKEDFESIKFELELVSCKLLDLLPDPSIGPEERIERIARIVPASIMNSSYRKTARTKLNYIRARLDELVPQENLSSSEKIDFLVEAIKQKVRHGQTLFDKLEHLGDNRTSDIGR